jgi:predicted nucleotidyltransferase
MPGFLETFPFVETIKSGELSLKTCPIEGLVMLKLISHNDRPQRTHDLTDIDNIIDEYFDWNIDEIYSRHNDLFDKYDTNDLKFYMPKIGAHIIGRKMKPLLIESIMLRQRVIGILEKSLNPRLESLLKGLLDK